MAPKATPLEWTSCRGRNGWDSPLHITPDMAAEALNWSFYDGGLGTKRKGGESVSVSGMSNFNALFGGYVPGQDETARELWAVDDSATNLIRRMAAGSSFSTITLPETITAANDRDISWAVGNGKLFIAYNGATNRIKVFDPAHSTTALRFGGIKTSAAPTTATNGGAGLSFTRWYRVAFATVVSSVIVRRSNLSVADDITIADDSGVTVTKPTNPGEGETHWLIYAADEEDGPYWLLTPAIAVGTTTFSDTSATIPEDEAAPDEGAYTPFPSTKYLLWLNDRLWGFGVWETTAGDAMAPLSGTVYITPPQGASSTHDDERVSNTIAQIGRITAARNAGGVDRGLSSLGNIAYAFQSRGIYAFHTTGNDDVPIRRVTMDLELGALTNESIVRAIDEYGRPALYFLDPELGPYRIARDGLQWCGRDVFDLWTTVNKAATGKVAHGTYYPAKQQIWWWIATGASNDPDRMIVFDCTLGRFENAREGVRGGWSTWTGTLATATCSTMMSRTLGATMSRDLAPYSGHSGTVLLRGDTGTQDNGTNYQAFLTSRAFNDWPLHETIALIGSVLEADAASGVTITQTSIRNLGDETNRTSTVLLTAAGSETEVRRKFEDASVVDVFAGQIRLGDAAAANTAFTLNRWEGLVEPRGIV